MEGDPEESDEDVQGEDRSTVLWEKCIQQSIFVDLSEDESLHFSDLESSLVLHLSQAESAASEPSIHLSGSAELSALDDTSSESSIGSSHNERVFESKSKCNISHVSVQRPNIMLDDPPLNPRYEDPEQNTSDEDQEDLPYDNELASPYFNQTATSEGNMSCDGRETVHASPDVPGLLELTTTDRDDTIGSLVSVKHNKKPVTLLKEASNTKQGNFFDASKPNAVAPPCSSAADINQLLLQHFSQEELLQSGWLIEAETLPEVSLLESVDETVFSLALTHNSTAFNSDYPGSPACHSENNQSFRSGMNDEKSNTASKDSNSEEEAEREIDNISFGTDGIASSSASTDSHQSGGDKGAVDAVKQEKAEEDGQDPKVPFVPTRLFSEMKYGQGQVHYPLPDFSKVAPKVKIPKAPSGPARPVPQSPRTMHKTQSPLIMLEVISRVLEDAVPPSDKPYVLKDEDKRSPPALVHHLQAEYDKLLTKYAEAENLIDQMRLGTTTQPTSELMPYSDAEYHQHLNADDQQRNLAAGSHVGSLVSPLPLSENLGRKRAATPQSNIMKVDNAKAFSQQTEEFPSDGERMTAELRDIASQFMDKVKEFKLSVSNMSVSTADQQMMLRSMMEAQDLLERNYISKKEEHRALEMQKYIGLSRNTGTFDPNRLVEGDIFRIGMHLEDIKEMLDKNAYEQISPPHSSSTPTPMEEMLHMKPSPLCMPTPSPPTSLHEGPRAVFSTVRYKIQQSEDKKQEEVEEGSELHGGGGLEQSSDVQTAGCFIQNTECNGCPSWSPWDSLEKLDIQTAKDQEGNEEDSSSVLGTDHSNILASISGSSSTSRQRDHTPASRDNTTDSVLNPEGECDLGDYASLAVEVSCSSAAPRDSDTHSLSEHPLTTSSLLQRIVSSETDSGFGSSYLNQSASGPFQPILLTESVQSHNDSLSSSDSEGSCSNLQTAIHSASLTSQPQACSHPLVQAQSCGAAAAVRLHGSDSSLPAQLHHCVAPPVLSSTMDTAERGSQLYPCYCNSDVILALQSEVSRLKKDLVEGLVQLPPLVQKLDYLTSKYKQDRHERRSKSRPRTHQRPACNSAWKPSGSTANVNTLVDSPAKVEDWISSDMDPSKSKGTDSAGTTGSEIMLQFHNSPAGSRRGNHVHTGPEFQYRAQETLRSSRAVRESFYSKERSSLLSSSSLQKPLLQVSYGSSSSLPASYKVREPPLESMSHNRKRFTQSDSALLPSNVYFQRTLSPASVPSKPGTRTGTHKVSKEEDMNRTLDQAIEVARSMKRTTDRMARRLSSDLAKAQFCRKLHSMQPLGGRKHHAL